MSRAPGKEWGFTGMQNYGVKTCFRCVLFMCPEGLEGTGAILVKCVHAEKLRF